MVTFTQIGSIAQRDMARSTFKLFKPFKAFNWFKHSNGGFARPILRSDHGEIRHEHFAAYRLR